MRFADLPSPSPTQAPPPIDPAIVTPGVLGFLVFALLIGATWLLLRSMNRRLHRIDVPHARDLPPEPGKPAGPPDE